MTMKLNASTADGRLSNDNDARHDKIHDASY